MHAYQEQLDEQVILLLLINKRSIARKNSFNCKRLEKTFRVCFLLDRVSNWSQFQQQDSTHNENQKKQPKKHQKKKNFGHQRKQTLEAIALDT